jgi:hypothetical protein
LAGESELANERAEVTAKIEELEQALKEPQRLYEQQRNDLLAWEAARARLVGDATTEGTLDYLAVQLDEVKHLPARRLELLGTRMASSQRVLDLLLQKVEMLRELYGPVQEFLQQNHLAQEHFSLEFHADLEFKDFGPGFFAFIDRSLSGSFYGIEASQQRVGSYVAETIPSEWSSVSEFLGHLSSDLESDSRGGDSSPLDCAADVLRKGGRLEDLYDYLFGLSYLNAQFELRSDGRPITELSPGQKGTILLMFYLLVDVSGRPILLDQPDDNLDNQTVHSLLRPAIQSAKSSRQVIVVTHSPNLAVVGDADQVIVASGDGEEFTYHSGSIEDPSIRDLVVDVLEGTWPAFTDRQVKYTASAISPQPVI